MVPELGEKADIQFLHQKKDCKGGKKGSWRVFQYGKKSIMGLVVQGGWIEKVNFCHDRKGQEEKKVDFDDLFGRIFAKVFLNEIERKKA